MGVWTLPVVSRRVREQVRLAGRPKHRLSARLAMRNIPGSCEGIQQGKTEAAPGFVHFADVDPG